MPVIMTFASVFGVSLIALIGILTLYLNENRLRNFSMALVALAAGALLGDAFFHLIPETFEGDMDPTIVGILVLAGIVSVMLFERLLWWHHDHHERDTLTVHDVEGKDPAPEAHTRIEPIGKIVLLSDGLHNALDGAAIAASYMASTQLGLATTLAIVFHEIPQEIGDFGILLHAGYTRARALLVNLLSALTAVLGAVIALLIGAAVEGTMLVLLPIAAGSFIYIALTDLIPELHRRRKGGKRFVIEMLAIVVGIALMFGLLFLES